MSIHYLALKRTTSLWGLEATLVISVWQGKTWLHFTLFHPQDTRICQACNPQVLPPVGASAPPPPPPVIRKKWQKLAISSKCLDFCPLRNAFLTENHRFSNLNVINIPKINSPLDLLITKLAGPPGNSPVGTGGLARWTDSKTNPCKKIDTLGEKT